MEIIVMNTLSWEIICKFENCLKLYLILTTDPSSGHIFVLDDLDKGTPSIKYFFKYLR